MRYANGDDNEKIRSGGLMDRSEKKKKMFVINGDKLDIYDQKKMPVVLSERKTIFRTFCFSGNKYFLTLLRIFHRISFQQVKCVITCFID